MISGGRLTADPAVHRERPFGKQNQCLAELLQREQDVKNGGDSQILLLVSLLTAVLVLSSGGLNAAAMAADTARAAANDPITADFSALPLRGVPPLRVQFTSLATGAFNECRWDFGDGTVVHAKLHPWHRYESEGRYTVSLTVRGPDGEDTISKEAYIIVSWYRSYVPMAAGAE